MSTPSPMMVDTLPQPSGSFRWVQVGARPALVCRALEDIAPHLFTTRHWPLGGGSTANRIDGWDDVAGATVLYPKSAPDVATGAISGSVSLNGSSVFGAHVFANSTTGNNAFSSFPSIRKTPIGMLTDTSGAYTILGLPPDSYEVIAEPLDGPVDNTNVDWAGDFGRGSVQTNFTTRWH